MASLEKLIKTIEQLRSIEETTTDANHVKKKEVRLLLSTLVELSCNTTVQSHKEYVSYISSSIDTIIKLYDSKESDVRLASDEGLYRIIKALLPLHSNRVLVEFCKQIKKSESPRVLKLSMNRFADLCHHARPQKRRAYLANLLNAISAIAARPEEMLHENLAHFVQKVFGVMGVFAYENETKTLLKTFFTNLVSHSAIIRRSAAIAITAIISNNRKSEILLALVVEYLTDQLLLPEDSQPKETPGKIGALLCLKMLLPLFPSTLIDTVYEPSKRSNTLTRQQKCANNPNSLTTERVVQLLELCVYYSMCPTDHNVVNAALELFQQLLKMRSILRGIPSLNCATGLHGTRIASRGLIKTNSQWNVSPLPVAEESHLFEAELSLNAFGRSGGGDSVDGEAEMSEVEFVGKLLSHQMEIKGSTDAENRLVESEEAKEALEDCSEQQDAIESVMSSTQVIDIGSLYDSKGYTPLLYCARHLAHHFLLTAQKGYLKSDHTVRVSVKCLALNCLVHVGSLDPRTWNTPLCEPINEGGIAVLDVLRYSAHDDPQLRGQAALLASSVLSSIFTGFAVVGADVKDLIRTVDETLKDRETSASRLALQGVQSLLPLALENAFCTEVVPLLNTLLTLSSNPYWLVKVDLLEAFSSLSWIGLEYGIQNSTLLSLPNFQRTFIQSVILTVIGDEDHRVRNAVANCLISLVRTWTTSKVPPEVLRVKRLMSSLTRVNLYDGGSASFAGIPVSINGLCKTFRDTPTDENVVTNLTFFINELLQLLVTSSSKFTKMGCIQSLSTLSTTYPPTAYPQSYGCNADGSCGILKLSIALMTSSALMLDLSAHQALLTLALHVFAGCVKRNSTTLLQSDTEQKEWPFLNSPCASVASALLSHISRILNAVCCILEDMNPLSNPVKVPLVTLPTPSALSPIRRKVSKAVEGSFVEKEDKPEESSRKWNKPTQLLNPNNLGSFSSLPLYVKLFDLLKGTYSTCKLNFDTATTERLSGFIQSVLDALATILEVAVFSDVGKHSEEILTYLRLVTTMEPVLSLYNVQQLLKSLFGANLAAVWRDDAARFKRSVTSLSRPSDMDTLREDTFFSSCGLACGANSSLESSPRKARISPIRERTALIVKFRTNVGKMGTDKVALSSHIRLFEPMVIKALKLYTVTSSPHVQKQVLDLLCELIHLCVNYCLLDADQVFLNFVIQQFEFLEEGFIPQVEILLPSMFRFLSLLSYDRYHSKTIISVPRIMQLSGGLMATGKDTQLYVLPTLRPMVEDLFLSKERMSDNFKELEAQREVLINILLRLIQYHEVYPLLSLILTQVQCESTVKWKSLSKQVCDVLVPQLQRHELDLDSPESLYFLHKLFSRLDPPIVHESLLGLLQTFSSARSDDPGFPLNSGFTRTLACRLAVMQILLAVFDESFLLDCLNEFNLGYLVNQNSDPLSATPTEEFSPERILSSLIIGALQSALSFWKSKLEADTGCVSSSSWKIEEGSFAARLVMDYISLAGRLQNSADFPVLQAAIRARLEEDECQKDLLQVAVSTIQNNPMVFVQICNFLQVKMSDIIPPFPSGLNGNVAQSGVFLVLCHRLKQDENPMDIIKSYADLVLRHVDAPPVKLLFQRLPEDVNYVDPLVNCVLKQSGKSLVICAMSLLKVLELYSSTSGNSQPNDEIVLKILKAFQQLPSSFVHHKMADHLMDWCQEAPCSPRFIEDLLRTIRQNPDNERYYSELLVVLGRDHPVCAVDVDNQVDKAFLLDYALASRQQSSCVWNKIAVHLESEDLPRLLDNRDCMIGILTGCRTLRPALFNAAKNWFFTKTNSGNLRRNQMVSSAQILTGFLDSIPRADIESALTPTEIGSIAKLALTFLIGMDSFYPSLVLLRASSDVLSRIREEAIAEWSKTDNSPSIYRAIDSLETFMIALKTGTGSGNLLHNHLPSGFEHVEGPALHFIDHARKLSRMVRFMELESTCIQEILRRDVKCVLVTLCRLPMFYSFVCIPPSVWSRGWDPPLELDAEESALRLPVIPSHFLHDEIVLKEFVYRIEEIGWITRQKFEEIWMSFLGILNLSTEDEVRPEEQASVVQATCEAVRALTMVLEKNLPFSGDYVIENQSPKFSDFMQTERGGTLRQLYALIQDGRPASIPAVRGCQFNRWSFNHISSNISLGSPSKSKSVSPENVSQIDIQSCVHFLVDLYAQWLQNSETSLALLVEVLRSLFRISNFFVDRQHFEWMFDITVNIQKQLLPDDPACLESALAGCLLKSAAFVSLNGDSWELVKKCCDASLSSQHISTRASGLDGIMYLLQKLISNSDANRSTAFAHVAMEYVGKYLGTENDGPDWHQSWLWSLAFYCGEHFTDLPFRSHALIDFVVQCALNSLLENKKQSVSIQHEILQGLEHLCILDKLPPNWRRLVKKEVINIIRNVERESVLHSALRTLLSLVYSDFVNQLYKPGADPETMLLAMEWVGALFQRMKRGTDQEADLLGRIMPIITCHIFPPADILNRILSEFMSARPAVAYCLTPTIFKVFGTARDHGQQSLVLEWILLSLSNFTRSSSGMTENVAVWNILCFFTAASRNPWLQSAFPLVSRPVDQNVSVEVRLFVASALDFRSQLDVKQRETLASIFCSAKEKSCFYAAVHAAFSHCQIAH